MEEDHEAEGFKGRLEKRVLHLKIKKEETKPLDEFSMKSKPPLPKTSDHKHNSSIGSFTFDLAKESLAGAGPAHHKKYSFQYEPGNETYPNEIESEKKILKIKLFQN